MPASPSDSVRCPLCHVPAATGPECGYTASESAQHFVLAQEYPERHAELQAHIDALWAQRNCQRYTCRSCELTYAWPFIAGDHRFYNLAYPYSSYPKQRWEFLRTLSSLSQEPLQDGPVLEIGSGVGFFLRQLTPIHVRPDQVLALEYSDAGRAQLVQHGFRALACDVRASELDPWRGRFTAAFLFQVLEHLDDVRGVTARLTELTRDGAAIFVAVPNRTRTAFNETRGALYDMPPNHISQWTPKALQRLADVAGWRLLACEYEPFRWLSFMRSDLVSAHMRQAQAAGSLANRARSCARGRARLLAEATMALSALPSRIPHWIAAASNAASLGSSLWVRYQR